MNGAETIAVIWWALLLSAAAIAPYVHLRRKAKAENWHTAIMHAYLPWLATVLVILGIFGIG